MCCHVEKQSYTGINNNQTNASIHKVHQRKSPENEGGLILSEHKGKPLILLIDTAL